MQRVVLKKLNIENFKGCKSREVEFADITNIKGQNASGKTTIVDAFLWLLFGIDSAGSTKFNIRPLDEQSNPIHFVDIKVEAELDISGKQYKLTKIQKEKWVKKRGSETQEFQGNANEFEINGYPKSEKEFKAFVADFVDEKLFRILTNPTTFTSLAWKEQREILFKLVTEVSDYEIANRNPEYSLLLPELEIASIDDIKAKYTKSKNELNKQLLEIPARIDEVSKQIETVDTAEMELYKNHLESEIRELNGAVDNIDAKLTAYNESSEKALKIKFQLSDMEREANAKLEKQRSEAKSKLSALNMDMLSKVSEIGSKERMIADYERNIEIDTKLKDELKVSYLSVKKREFDNSSLVCSFCGQEYPSERKDAIRAEFDAHKVEELDKIAARGSEIAEEIKNFSEKVNESKAFLALNIKEKAEIEKKISEINVELANIPASVDISGDPKYQELQKELVEAEKAMNAEYDVKFEKEKIKTDISLKQQELEKVIASIAKADCSAAEARKAELEAEQANIAQRVADCEKMLYLVETFTKEKLDIISDMVNSKFKIVNFLLFAKQINGGIAETCECTVNGIPISSLNAGHRIVAGLDIINALSNIYEISVPVLVDNAETINKYNIPAVDSQLILMTVTEDKEIIVEV